MITILENEHSIYDDISQVIDSLQIHKLRCHAVASPRNKAANFHLDAFGMTNKSSNLSYNLKILKILIQTPSFSEKITLITINHSNHN